MHRRISHIICLIARVDLDQTGAQPTSRGHTSGWQPRLKKEVVEIKITGIDMSSAFDTIDRQTLLDILREIIEEDELRIYASS